MTMGTQLLLFRERCGRKQMTTAVSRSKQIRVTAGRTWLRAVGCMSPSLLPLFKVVSKNVLPVGDEPFPEELEPVLMMVLCSLVLLLRHHSMTETQPDTQCDCT